MSNILENRIPALIKYPGGKNRELGTILKNLPKTINNYYEPFVGGGSVYFSIKAKQYFINDKSTELMNVYEAIQSEDENFLEIISQFNHNWIVMSRVVDNHSNELFNLYIRYKNQEISKLNLREDIHTFLNLNVDEFNGLLKPTFNVEIENFIYELEKSIINKLIRMETLEQSKGELSKADIVKNIEGAFKSAFYMHFRYLYNLSDELVKDDVISKGYATAIFVFIRQYCYSSMFRFNKSGEFNVPYGGISYNRQTLSKNIENYSSDRTIKHLKKTTLGNMDFYKYMSIYPIQEGDFMFVDPPYDTEFSTYDQNKFDKADQIRLADYLINECHGNFMMIIKYTEFIESLYPGGIKTANNKILKVTYFDKRYSVSFKDRNNQNVVHMLITNY